MEWSRAKANRVLLRKCTVIANTLFQQHKRRLYTWTSPDGQHQNQKSCTKKIFMTKIITMVLITHLEPDILECEVKWALESMTTNKASGGDRIPFELFQILKDDAVKVLHSIYQQIWKTQQWPEDWKRSVFIPIPKKGNAKECSNYPIIALISR